MLALISELEEFPDDPLADESRQLVDLGLLMCESSDNEGITSTEGNHSDARLLPSGAVEAWNLIKRARDEVWEKLGLDANVFYCPESADDIDLEAARSRSTLVQPEACPEPNATPGFSLVQPEACPVSNATSGFSLVQPLTYSVPDNTSDFLNTNMAWSTLPVSGEAFRPEDSMVDFNTMGFEHF